MPSSPSSARIFTLITLGLALLAGTFSFFNFGELSHLPWDDKTALFFPSLTALDQNGRSYTSDSATRRIVAINKDGTLLRVQEGGKRSEGFYCAQGLAVDSRDRLYVYNWVPYAGIDYKAERVEIQRYDLTGRLEKTILKLPNTADSADFPNYFSFSIQKDSLYYILGDGKTFRFFKASLEGTGVALIRELPASDFVSISGNDQGVMAGAARNGSLWVAPVGGVWRKLELPLVRKPWDLKYLANGNLLILDLIEGKIFSLRPDGVLETVLSTGQTKGTFADTFSVSPNGAVVVADKEFQRILVSEEPGQFRAYVSPKLTSEAMLFRWFVWTCITLALLLGLTALLLFYFFFIHRRTPLLLIQLGLFVPIIIAVQAFAFNQVHDALFARYTAQVKDTLLNSANLTAKLIRPADVRALNAPADLDSEAYKRVKETAGNILKQGQDTGAFSYIALYRKHGNQITYVYTASGTFGVDYPYTVLPHQAERLFEKAGSQYAQYFDDYGVYNAAFASLTENGQPSGVVEVGLFADLVNDFEESYLSSARTFALISGGAFVFIFILLTLLLLRSLNTLRRITREIADGNMDLSLQLRSKDEVGQLSRDFETMSGRLKGFIANIQSLTAASARFVPRDFIDLLQQDDLTKLRLGDQTSQNMTVVFSSILNFGKVTGHMTTQGLFKYLNSYLSSVVPAIRSSHGLIDKYIGDTYMALFPGSPADALGCYKLVRRRIQSHNRKRLGSGSEGLSLSFGIHFGSLMLGIVGEEERLEGTVISDAVNLTSRLNGLCRLYGIPCVVSMKTLEEAAGGQDPLLWKQENPYRKIDFVMVKGKSEPILICEPLDELDPEQKDLLKRLPLYDDAFSSWETGDLTAASKAFDLLEKALPHDLVIQKHAERCRNYLRQGLPADWSPAVKFTEK